MSVATTELTSEAASTSAQAARRAADQSSFDVRERVGERPFPAPPLGDPDELAAPVGHLPDVDAGEADGVGPSVDDRRPGGSRGAAGQRPRPPLPDPATGPSDVVLPERVAPRDPGVEPHRAARFEQDGAATAASAG